MLSRLTIFGAALMVARTLKIPVDTLRSIRVINAENKTDVPASTQRSTAEGMTSKEAPSGKHDSRHLIRSRL